MERPLRAARSVVALLAGCTPLKGGATRLECASLDEGAREIYADVHAAPDGTGTIDCPFGTITEAIGAARGHTGTVVHAAAGTYSAATGEVFPLQLRNGVSLQGAGAASTVISGGGTFLFLEEPRVVTMVLGDQASPTRVAELTVESTLWQSKGQIGILCDRGNATAAEAPPNTVLERISARGYEMGVVSTFEDGGALQHGCALQLLGSELAENLAGLWVTYGGHQDERQTADVGDGTEGGRCTFSGNLRGIMVWDRTARVRVRRASFFDDPQVPRTAPSVGIEATAHHQLPARIEVEDSDFHDLEGGMFLLGRIDTQVLRNVFRQISKKTETGSGVALIVNGDLGGAPEAWGRITRARQNEFSDNDGAVELSGFASPDAMPGHDFGTDEDPGENVFRCSSSGDVLAPSSDVHIELRPPATVVALAGNVWDHAPPTQSSAPAPADGTDLWVSDRGATTVVTTNATVDDSPCPARRTR